MQAPVMVAAALMLIAGTIGATAAENTYSATWVMPGCRALVAGIPEVALAQDINTKAHLCLGVVSGVADTAISSGMACATGVPFAQIVHTVVDYIDDRPTRMNERFTALVLEAIDMKWPCR